MVLFLAVVIVLGVTFMFFGQKNIVKGIGFWLVGLATLFTFLFLLIVMYFSTSPTPSTGYILEEEIVIESRNLDDK
ncbi:hypothetical protein [Ornithinibacillus bavariensis]|uniref:Uncharacterized protein n=1 Tax=Ornithinibacillus bavariensis TaxID=545502 RepID=A0A919X544_9BACI|nr:hypothetical protein [Ornithinibacillus bavariensis]GIO25879.1 hypothetical protein J43TS3_04900 [Ornithinibacillus bavariensis]HAM79717.1 hypothetical protein [Ornithinibacillus sp.]